MEMEQPALLKHIQNERLSTGAEEHGNAVKSERTLAIECMPVAVSIGQMICRECWRLLGLEELTPSTWLHRNKRQC